MRAWMLTMGLGLAMASAGSACSSDECSTNADCPAGRLCRLGLCALDPNLTDGTSSTDTTFVDIPLDCTAATAGDLVMNEIMADPPSGADIDQNGIASTTEDEFVEVVNVSSRAVAMTNVQIDVNGKRVQLGATCLNPNQARVVFGSMGLPSLSNSGATVSLLVDGVVAQAHTYGSEAGHDESITLKPQLDPNGEWVRAGTTWGPAYTPGKCSDENLFPSCTNDPVAEQDVETVDTTDGDTVTPSCSTLPVAGDLVINELMADPGPVSGGNDSNGDGVVDSDDDEFVEIVNVSTSTLLLDGVKLTDSGSKTFTFPAGTCVAPNQAVVIFGKYQGTGSFPGVIVLGASGLSLNNDADSAILKAAADGAVLAQVSYGAEAGADQSITRTVDLDPTSAFVKHSLAPNAGGRKMSPGTCQSGAAFPDCGTPPVEGDDTDATTGEVVDDATTTTTDDTTTTTANDTTVTPDTGPECGPLAIAADLVINEVLLDPPAGFDSNGDGTADTTQDEFVELVNIGAGAVKLEGLKLWDSAAAKYTFGATVCLQPHDAVVVFGKGAQQFDVSGKVAIDATSHALDLNNSGDTVALKAADGTVILTETFGSASDQSYTRSPDTSGAFVTHKTANSALAASPGQCLDGTAMPGCLGQPR